MPGKRGKQSVKKGIWYIGGKRKTRKRQRGKGFPLGLLASIGVPDDDCGIVNERYQMWMTHHDDVVTYCFVITLACTT